MSFATLYFPVFQMPMRVIYYKGGSLLTNNLDHKAVIKSYLCNGNFSLCLVCIATLAASTFISHLSLIFHLCCIPLDRSLPSNLIFISPVHYYYLGNWIPFIFALALGLRAKGQRSTILESSAMKYARS